VDRHPAEPQVDPGRPTVRYATDGGGDSTWADAGTVTGDAVLSQAETAYDANGNVTQTTDRERFHDETATGALGDPTTAPKARVYSSGAYHDAADRLTAAVDVGTNGGTAWTRPPSAPARSDTALETSYAYNAAGWVSDVTDPRGVDTQTGYDALGEVTQTQEDAGGAAPKVTSFSYDGDGHLVLLAAAVPGVGKQQTQFVYGVSTAAVSSNDLLAAVEHPDPASGDPSTSQEDTYTYNALGEVATATDRNGTVHTYSRDVLGRLTSDAVTTLGSGVDGAVRRLETAYDAQGNAYRFTGYDAASAGNVVNQVQRSFNGLGQLTAEYQSHAGAVNTATTPSVGYSYTEMAGGANNSRPTALTYPSGRVLSYNYASGLDDSISRLSSISDSSGTLEAYSYLGLDTVVRRSHPQPGLDLTYVKQAGEANGDAGDQYTGLDRFGRVVDQRWVNTSTGTATDRFQYGYDRDSNVTWKDNLVNSAFGELYGYDGLNQLASFQRGTLNAGHTGLTGSASRSQSWSLDAMGNFASVTSDGTPQTRTHNAQDEVTAVGGSTLAFDADGNLTTDDQGHTLVYDAWNRLVAVRSGAATLSAYGYDALGRRAVEATGGATRDLYYSSAWQVLEERQGGQAQVQYVWSPVYVDALVERDRDADGNGTLEERLYAQQDAGYNVTALVNASGQVVERFAYDPYGQATFLSANWSTASDGYGWKYLRQGERLDAAAGLYDSRFRVYSPSLGRWLQADPVGLAGGDTNLYRAEADGPIGNLDPSGLHPPDRLPGDGMAEQNTTIHRWMEDLWEGAFGVAHETVLQPIDLLGTAIDAGLTAAGRTNHYQPHSYYGQSSLQQLQEGKGAWQIGLENARNVATLGVYGMLESVAHGMETRDWRPFRQQLGAMIVCWSPFIKAAWGRISRGLRTPAPRPVPQGHTRVYRAVSEAEYQDILRTGRFNPAPNALEGRWFADTLEGAQARGRGLYPQGGFRIIEADVPNNAPSLFQLPNLDGHGPARFLHLDDLGNVTPRPAGS
jgi:RHS repeat-associated protein